MSLSCRRPLCWRRQGERLPVGIGTTPPRDQLQVLLSSMDGESGTWCPEAWRGSMEQEESDGRKSLTCCSGSWSRCKGTSLEAIGRESTGRGWSVSWLLGSGAGITSASRVHPSVKVSTHYSSRCRCQACWLEYTSLNLHIVTIGWWFFCYFEDHQQQRLWTLHCRYVFVGLFRRSCQRD